MLVKSKRAITIQNGMVGTESKELAVKFGAIQSNDLMQTAKIGFSVADAKSQLQTQQGPRPNMLGNTAIELTREELDVSSDLGEFKSLLRTKLANFFSPLNAGISADDFEEVV